MRTNVDGQKLTGDNTEGTALVELVMMLIYGVLGDAGAGWWAVAAVCGEWCQGNHDRWTRARPPGRAVATTNEGDGEIRAAGHSDRRGNCYLDDDVAQQRIEMPLPIDPATLHAKLVVADVADNTVTGRRGRRPNATCHVVERGLRRANGSRW